MAEQELTDALAETLSLFEAGGEPLTTTDVAEQVDLGRRSTYERLDRLVDRGRLETKKVGAKARVWWRPAVAGDRDGGVGAGDRAVDAGSLVDVLDRSDVGVFVLDASLSVVWANEATERYFGLDRERVVGRDELGLVDEVIAPAVEDSAAFAERVRRTYDDNADSECFECHVTADDGRAERWLEHRSKPIDSGALAGGRVELYYDVTPRKRAERARRAEHTQFESLVTAVEDYAIFMLDPEGHVRTWNRGAEQITEYDADAIIGEHASTFYTEADRRAGVPAQALAAAAESGSFEDECWQLRADDSAFWANVTVTAIRGPDGTLRGYAKVTHDLTDQRDRERRLRRERDLTRRLFETAPVRLAVFSADGTLTRVNAAARAHLSIDESDPSTFRLPDLTLYDSNGEPLPAAEHPVRRVIDTGEPVSERLLQHDTPDGDRRWAVLTASPMFDEAGNLERVVVTGKDVTELKRAQQQLERERDELEHELQTVFDRIDDAFFALDTDWQFVHLNDRACELLERSVGELLGQHIWDAFPEAVDSTFRDEYERALDRQESVTFEQYYPPLATWFEVAAYPSESGLSVYFRDVTARKEREQELEQYETVIQTVGDGAYMLDADNRFVLVNDAHCALTGYDREELLGAHASLVTTDECLARADRSHVDVLESSDTVATVETEIRTAGDETVPVETRFAPVAFGDGEYGRAGVVRDITERKERERELGRYETIVETVDDGIYTLTEDGRFAFVNESYKEMVGLPSVDLLGRERTILAEKGVIAPETFDRAREVDAQLRDGARDSASIEAELHRPDGTVVEGEATFNRLSMDTGEERVAVVRDITERKERERELERRREQLAALDSLNRVVREITSAVIDRSTRAEIESTVCELLAASDSYLFAWIGEVDTASETVRLRTEAGVEGYLDDVVISVDPDDERSEGATGRAFRTGEMQTTREPATDSRYEVWREQVDAYGFRSSAAIPIVHEGSLYGTLNVYAERPGAFDGQERAVVEQLGAVVGHAIAATERKQALMSSEVVELQFHIRDVFGAVDLDEGMAGTVTLDHFVAVADDEFLVYGTVTPEAVDGLHALVEVLSHWTGVTVRDGPGERSFELRVAEPPVLSAVAGVGGAVERAVIDDGDYEMTVHVPPSGDVGQIIDTVEEAYPTVQLRKRRQVTRDVQRADRANDDLLGGLTDRQRTALETAYHAGFFDWPRVASGEDVAESLGIAAPTFHQHLRKAERGVFGRLLSDGD